MELLDDAGSGTYAWDNGWAEARRRLDLLEQCWDPDSFNHLRAAGVEPGWRCLEVGGGGGSIVRWLCDEVGPDGGVVTVDLDTRFLASLGRENLEVIEADVVTAGLPPGPFDLVHTRAVLMHIPARDRLLPDLVDRLRPGGLLLLEEPDFHSFDAAESRRYADFVWRFADTLSRAVGMAATWGRSLPSRLAGLGLTDVQCHVTTRVFPGGSPDAEFYRITFLQARDLLLADGGDKDEFDAVLEMLDDPGQWFPAPAMVRASGRRPG